MKNKETKEAILGLMKLSVLLAEVLKDGVDMSDVAVLFTRIQLDYALKDALMEAVTDISKVPSEIGEMGISEYIDIGVAVAKEVPAILAALQKV